MEQKTTIKIILGLILFSIFSLHSVQAQNGKLSGKVLDKDGQPAPSATVKLLKGADFVKGTLTDNNGRYQFGVLAPGEYIVEASDGDKTVHYNVSIGFSENQQTLIEMAIAYEGEEEGAQWSTSSDGVIIMPDNELFTTDPFDGITVKGDDIRKMPIPRSNLENVAAIVGRTTQKDHGDPVNMSGARPGGTAMYIDNMKIRGNGNVPQAAISQLTVINGGIPAEFGDLTGGLIVVTTRNPGMRGFVGKPRNYERRQLRRQLRKAGKKGVQTGFDQLMVMN